MNRMPDFLICGAQKAGTTSLNFYLRNHPDIYIPWKKELHFFDNDSNFNKGIVWYTKHFSKADKESITGESTPIYMYLDKVPVRIVGAMPSVKLIFILRNPVERAWSHYWDSVKRGKEFLSFENAVKNENERIQAGEESRRFFSYVDRGKYIDQIERYLKYFTRTQMYFILTEDLRNNPGQAMAGLLNFLGVKSGKINAAPTIKHEGKIPVFNSLNTRFRESLLNKYFIPRKIYESLFLKKNRHRMDPDIKKYLYNHFENYNRELSTFLGHDGILWRFKEDAL